MQTEQAVDSRVQTLLAEIRGLEAEAHREEETFTVIDLFQRGASLGLGLVRALLVQLKRWFPSSAL